MSEVLAVKCWKNVVLLGESIIFPFPLANIYHFSVCWLSATGGGQGGPKPLLPSKIFEKTIDK